MKKKNTTQTNKDKHKIRSSTYKTTPHFGEGGGEWKVNISGCKFGCNLVLLSLHLTQL